MQHAEYFANLDEIENAWRQLRTEGFPQKLRDNFWGLCNKGQMLFWKMAEEYMRNGTGMVCTVPAFQRAIMLLEHEQRFKGAIKLCEEAQKWRINTDWYSKRIMKLKKRLEADKE